MKVEGDECTFMSRIFLKLQQFYYFKIKHTNRVCMLSECANEMRQFIDPSLKEQETSEAGKVVLSLSLSVKMADVFLWPSISAKMNQMQDEVD